MWPLFGGSAEEQGKIGARARRVRANTQAEPPAGPAAGPAKEEGLATLPSRSSAAIGSAISSSRRTSSSRNSTGGGNGDDEAAHVVGEREVRRMREISPMRRPDDAAPLPDEVPVEEIAAMVERQVSSKVFEPASSGMQCAGLGGGAGEGFS